MRLVSTIVEIDETARTATVSDRTVMAVAPEIALERSLRDRRVGVAFSGDEDGYAPARAVRPVE